MGSSQSRHRHPKCGGQGVLEEGPRHLGLIPVLPDQPGHLARDRQQRRVEDIERLTRLEHGGGVDRILGRRPVVNPLCLLLGQTPANLFEKGCQWRSIAPGGCEDGVRVDHGGLTGFGHCLGVIAGCDACVGKGEGEGRLEPRHRLDPTSRGEDSCHLLGGEAGIKHQKSKKMVSSSPWNRTSNRYTLGSPSSTNSAISVPRRSAGTVRRMRSSRFASSSSEK